MSKRFDPVVKHTNNVYDPTSATTTGVVNFVVNASDYTIVAGEPVVLFETEEVATDQGGINNSVTLAIDYLNLSPDVSKGSFRIGVEILARHQGSTEWYPIGEQYSPYVGTRNAQSRKIVIQPNLAITDEGETISAPLGTAKLGTTRLNGFVPEGHIKVVVTLIDNLNVLGSEFQSVGFTMRGELHNV